LNRRGVFLGGYMFHLGRGGRLTPSIRKPLANVGEVHVNGEAQLVNGCDWNLHLIPKKKAGAVSRPAVAVAFAVPD
jgi:hypothetical protein